MSVPIARASAGGQASAGVTGSAGAGGPGIGGMPESPTAGASALAGSGVGGAATGGSGAAGGPGTAGAGGRSGAGAGGASAGSGGTVTLPPGVASLFPLPGATNVCPDPPLRVGFSAAPSVGSAGKLRVFDSAQPATAVVTVDFATMNVTETIGGQAYKLPRPVFTDGNAVAVNLPQKALARGKTYYVLLDAGAISGPGNASFSVTDSKAWTFTTSSAAPKDPAALRVALDGTGDFCSPQGAIDAVPANNEAKVRIDLEPGVYHGVVRFSGKHNLELHGADRKKVVISGVNNNDLNPSTKGRALFGADGANGLVIDTLTIQNLTPQGGTQAEALRLESCDKCVVRHTDVLSLQDTLLWSGRLYADDCYIAGNVDFVWGTGVAYFNQCEIKTVGRSGYVVQSRNAAGANGYVFVDSKITADAGITGSVLARIDVSAYPGSQVAYIDCEVGPHISSAAWTITGGSAGSSLRFWEYRSHNAAGGLLSTTGRASGSKQLTADEAAAMRDKAAVLGGWLPPN